MSPTGVWDDFSLNPQELIEAIWRDVPDWQDSYEFPDGLFRKNVPHFDEVVVRELLANALVHRPYTQGGDIFINLYPDRLEVHNPGLLPLGVTVIMARRVAHPEVIDLIDKADLAYQLRHRERITLGLIAQHESLTAIQLCKVLALKNAEALQPWIGRLGELELVLAQGRTKGTTYKINPDVLRAQNFRGRTSLKGIERQLRSELLAMVKDGVLLPIGEGGGRCVHGISDSACIHTADCRIIVF